MNVVLNEKDLLDAVKLWMKEVHGLTLGEGAAYQFMGKPSSSNFAVNVSEAAVVLSKVVGTPGKKQSYREQGDPG